MDEITPIVGAIMALNAFVTYKGLEDRSFFTKYLFRVRSILADKEFVRLFTSGFLHANWMHFGFNMLTLFFFGPLVESAIGSLLFATLYIASLLGGDILALLFHRNNGEYSAIGASGAVTGVVFASIALNPGMELGLLIIPFISFPSWVFGLLYVAYSIYGIKSRTDNIGHEAHLGGGITGLLIALIISPQSLFTNYLPILAILIPTVLFLILYMLKPSILFLENPFKREKGVYDIDDQYNLAKANRQRELDYLLDKINRDGIDSLSESQKARLEELSK